LSRIIYGVITIFMVIILLGGCISGEGGDTTTSPPTTAAPTTAAPTTAAPTTAAPTKAAPTTAAPTETSKPSEMDNAWTMQYHDNYNTSYSSSTLSGTPEEQWHKNGTFNGSAAIEYGMVYFPVFRYENAGDTKLICLDLEDGTLIWEKAMDHNFTETSGRQGYARSPAVYEGKVVFLSCGSSCKLYCFDAYDGTQLWSKTIDAEYRAYETPVIYEGKIYTLYVNSLYNLDLDTVPSDFDHGIVGCYDLETGDVIWTNKLNLALYGVPVIYDDKLYFGAVDGTTSDGYLVCLSADDGGLLWMEKLLDEGHKIFFLHERIWQIAYGHGNIYMTMYDFDFDWEFFGYATIASYDPDTGDLRWKFRTDSGTMFDNHLVLSEEYVYFGILWNLYGEPNETYIYKLDPADGSILWRSDLPSFMEFMSMGGNTLYLGYSESIFNVGNNNLEYRVHLYGINGTSGETSWTFLDMPDYADFVKYSGMTATIADDYMVLPIGFWLYCFS